jgi:hypothetical protein
MTRHTLLLLLAALATVLVSCRSPKSDVSAQPSERTRFAANGGGGFALRSTKPNWSAGVSVLWGYPLTPDGYVAAESERVNLIYIVSGHPHAQFTDRTMSNEEFTASWSFSGEVQAKSFTMSLAWDNRTEIVTAAHQQFNRTKGNVFVLLLNANGEVTCQQLPSLGPAAGCISVLHHVQQYCADKAFASSLSLDTEVWP